MIETNVSGKSTGVPGKISGKPITGPGKSRRTSRRKYVDHNMCVTSRCPHHWFKDEEYERQINVPLNLPNCKGCALRSELSSLFNLLKRLSHEIYSCYHSVVCRQQAD